MENIENLTLGKIRRQTLKYFQRKPKIADFVPSPLRVSRNKLRTNFSGKKTHQNRSQKLPLPLTNKKPNQNKNIIS